MAKKQLIDSNTTQTVQGMGVIFTILIDIVHNIGNEPENGSIHITKQLPVKR